MQFPLKSLQKEAMNDFNVQAKIVGYQENCACPFII